MAFYLMRLGLLIRAQVPVDLVQLQGMDAVEFERILLFSGALNYTIITF